jgi:TRAP-type C4-dicarboxylate transport system permease small subunit
MRGGNLVAAVTDFAANKALVLQRHRHLKWLWLDWLEKTLMILCGVCLGGFTLCVLCDVVTREIGYPWLWLQQATTGFFAWGVFIGIAAATRRNDHIYLAEITKAMTGAKRTAIEIANRVIVLIVAGIITWFGYKNALLDLGSFRMPSIIPLTVYTCIVPVSGALVMLFCVEQIVNGWQRGFEGPEDTELLTEPVT